MSTRTRPAAADATVLNLKPCFGWAAMVLFCAVVLGLTMVIRRDGPPPGQPAWLQLGAMLVCLFGGVIAGWRVLRIPCTRLVVLPDGAVALTRFWLMRRDVQRIPRTALAGVTVERGRDGEGDPYWRTFLVLADGAEILVAEGHDMRRQRDAAEGLARALGCPEPR